MNELRSSKGMHEVVAQESEPARLAALLDAMR